MWSVSQVLSQSENASCGHSGEVNFYLIDVAPTPILTGLDGPHNRVVDGVKVLCSVLILGRVAAADVAARHAQSQMNPSVAHFQALLAPVRVGFNVSNLIGVRAMLHPSPPLFSLTRRTQISEVS
jgi:hypothetical protein